MEFALTQEVSEQIINNGVSGHINNLSDRLSDFLKSKNYGTDLRTIYIGIICVSPEFDFFFKVRKPKYKKGKIVTCIRFKDSSSIQAKYYSQAKSG